MKKLMYILLIFIPLGYLVNLIYALNIIKISPIEEINSRKFLSGTTEKFNIYGYYPYWKYTEFPAIKINENFFDGIFHAFIWPSKAGRLVVPSGLKDESIIKALAGKGKIISISVGGGGHSFGFKSIAENPAIRRKFISNLTNFVKKNGYNGIDIDWEYPNGDKESKILAQIAQELRINLPDINLTTALPLIPSDYDINVSIIEKVFDHIFIMAYDVESGFDGYSGYNAPLYKNIKMPIDYSIETAIYSEYIDKGIKREKLILGIPLYARKYNTTFPYMQTNTSTELEYKDLPFDSCTKEYYVGFFLQCKTYYISYDDIQSVNEKISFAKKEGLGGVYFWALGQDDNKILNQLVIK